MNEPAFLLSSGWVAQVHGSLSDLDCWCRHLRKPGDPVCEWVEFNGDSICVIRSSEFDNCNDPDDVRSRALKLIATSSGALRLEERVKPLILKAIGRTDDHDDIVNLMVFAEGRAEGIANMLAVGAALNPNPTPPSPPAPSDVQKWINMAESDAVIKELLDLVGRLDYWEDIYNAVELVLAITKAKGISLEGYKTKLKDVKGNANKHRHSSKGPGSGPSVEISLFEAVAFVPRVVKVLLNALAAKSP